MAERRGFAAMTEERQREIASRGGRAAHQRGTAHEWSEAEATEAGRKGGAKVSRDRQHMAEIGRKGGHAARRRHAAAVREPTVQHQVSENHEAQDNMAAVPGPIVGVSSQAAPDLDRMDDGDAAWERQSPDWRS